MQRNYTEVRSEGEKRYLNSHPLKISHLRSPEIGFWCSLCLGEPQPECKFFSSTTASAVILNCGGEVWVLGIKLIKIGLSHVTAHLPYTSLTGIFVFLVYVKHICSSGPGPCYSLSREFLSLESSDVSPSATSSNAGSPQLGWALIEDLTCMYSTWNKPHCLRR